MHYLFISASTQAQTFFFLPFSLLSLLSQHEKGNKSCNFLSFSTLSFSKPKIVGRMMVASWMHQGGNVGIKKLRFISFIPRLGT